MGFMNLTGFNYLLISGEYASLYKKRGVNKFQLSFDFWIESFKDLAPDLTRFQLSFDFWARRLC